MEYQVDVPEGESGDWKVSRFTVSKDESDLDRLRGVFNGSGRYCPPGTYTRLSYRRSVVMSDTPDEIRDHRRAIMMAKHCDEPCLVNGLGLGMVANAMLLNGAPKVIAIEISSDVINLVGPHWKSRWGDRLEIINADAFEWKPPRSARYAVVWHDIWPTICADNLPEMTRLSRKYGRRAGWQGCWSKSELLRCRLQRW